MTGPSKKRQKREDYRQAQENAAKAPKDVNGNKLELPKKKYYRQRAHANPFSDHNLTYPVSPQEMDWTTHYPAFMSQNVDKDGRATRHLTRNVEIADIGCGFGGLLVALSPLFPHTLMVGMELRTQVLSYVTSRISALRSQHNTSSNTTTESQGQIENPSDSGSSPPTTSPPLGPYQNISAIRTNTMKFLPNFFPKSTLSSIFLCFPDPHFKARKHKARIVSAQLNAEYVYVLRPGGKVYTVTDVEELHQWIVKHFVGDEAGNGRELWERVGEQELKEDRCARVMCEETEEAKKVSRNGGTKFVAVFRRRENPDWAD